MYIPLDIIVMYPKDDFMVVSVKQIIFILYRLITKHSKHVLIPETYEVANLSMYIKVMSLILDG